MSILSQPHFYNEKVSYEFIEARFWPQGAVCPRCGACDRISKMGGKSPRIGAYKCYHCRKPLTVKFGTLFQSSHIPMRLWLQAIFLISSSKKGISSNQLLRILGITLKSAWFMSHRIREDMRSGDMTSLGGNRGVVEADETLSVATSQRSHAAIERAVATNSRTKCCHWLTARPDKRAAWSWMT